ARHRRRSTRRHAGVRRGDVFLPGLPRVPDRLPGRRELRRTVRTRPRRGRSRRRVAITAAKSHPRFHARLAVHGPATIAARRRLAALVSTVRFATRRPRNAAAAPETPARTGSPDAGDP